MSQNNPKQITADEARLRAVLSEKGLPFKVGAKKLNPTELKLHSVICSTYSFQEAKVKLDVPVDVFKKLGDNFFKIWQHKIKPDIKNNKVTVLFFLTPEALVTTIKTTTTKDQSIFTAPNGVKLHPVWSKRIHISKEMYTTTKIDWEKAEKNAHAYNEHIKQEINDGKTFNAQKDNPWARKNLKNRNQ